ncbi:MAG: C-type lectin domain-containing protein [Planctomycetota bacterium]
MNYNTWGGLLAYGLAWVLSGAVLAQDATGVESLAGRSVQPTAEELESVEPRIEAVFLMDEAVASRAARLALAQRLVDAAHDVTDDPVLRYAMWRSGGLLAARSGGTDLALEAWAALFEHFSVTDHLSVFETLRLVGRGLENDADAIAFVALCSQGASAALVHNDPRSLARYAQYAEAAKRRVTQRDAAKRVESHIDEIRDRQEVLQAVARAQLVLRRSSANPAARRLLGLYDGLVRGDVEQARAHWEATADPQLALITAAWREPRSADALAVGQVWVEVAESEQGLLRRRAGLQAADWLQQAQAKATGLDKIVAEQQLATAYRLAGLPAGYAKLSEEEREKLVRYGEKWLLLVDERMDHAAAASWAAEREGTLVSIASASENRFVTRVAGDARTVRRGFWAGGVHRRGEAGWRWADSSEWRYVNWGRRKPNGRIPDTGDHFLRITRTGEWDPVEGDARLVFIVQWPIEE